MLAAIENMKTLQTRVADSDAKQLPPSASKLILYGARDMSKKKFYFDEISRYAKYLRRCFLPEFFLHKYTRAKHYSQPTCLVGTSRKALQTLQLQKQMNICFVSITLFNLPYLLRNRIKFIALSPLKYFLDKMFVQQMDSVCPSLKDEFQIEAYLQKNNFSCFIYDTPTTINNLLAYFFKKQGKKVIYLQHGIYQLSNYKMDDATKTLATGFVVWGEAFKQLLIDNGIHKSKIRIGCINKPVKGIKHTGKTKRICFFGLPLTKFSTEVCAEMLVSVLRLHKICSELGYQLVYKPHPMENVADTKQKFDAAGINVPISKVKRGIQDSLRSFEVFAGFYSTSLVEAALVQKKTLQILLNGKEYDDFNKLNVCSSIRWDDPQMDKLVRDITEQTIVTAKPDSYYIRYTDNPGLRYKQCIQSILNETQIIISNDELYA